jgi:hypothetical protein
MTAAFELQAVQLPQQPPLVDWLEALSHDSPFECGPDRVNSLPMPGHLNAGGPPAGKEMND